MTVDHIGYAVKRLDRAQKAFEKLGFLFEELVEDTARNVAILFGEKDGYRIELVSPLNPKEASPVDSVLAKVGPTAYHFCYKTKDMDREISELSGQGFRVILEPAPAVAFGGKRVVFLMNLGIGLMELVEE